MHILLSKNWGRINTREVLIANILQQIMAS